MITLEEFETICIQYSDVPVACRPEGISVHRSGGGVVNSLVTIQVSENKAKLGDYVEFINTAVWEQEAEPDDQVRLVHWGTSKPMFGVLLESILELALYA